MRYRRDTVSELKIAGIRGVTTPRTLVTEEHPQLFYFVTAVLSEQKEKK